MPKSTKVGQAESRLRLIDKAYEEAISWGRCFNDDTKAYLSRMVEQFDLNEYERLDLARRFDSSNKKMCADVFAVLGNPNETELYAVKTYTTRVLYDRTAFMCDLGHMPLKKFYQLVQAVRDFDFRVVERMSSQHGYIFSELAEDVLAANNKWIKPDNLFSTTASSTYLKIQDHAFGLSYQSMDQAHVLALYHYAQDNTK